MAVLPEVIVTAERRSENIQKAGLAVTVLDSATLTSEGRIASVQRVLEDVPSVAWRFNTGTLARNDTEATSISIRGIGANGSVNGAVLSLVPAVALYTDDVLGGLGSDYDISRVEVLRGPQGTLYGRSATSGVVAFHANQPALEEFGGQLGAEVGSYDLRRVSGAVNVPVASTLALRVSGQHLQQDGYYSTLGDHIDEDEGRVKLLFRPSDVLTIQLGAAYQRRDFHSGGPTPQITPSGFDFSLVAPIGTGNDTQSQYWADVSLDLGPAVLTYIPAWRTYEKTERQFGYFGTATVDGLNNIDRDTYLTHELRLASNNESKLKWQAGFFYYKNDISANFLQTTQIGPVNVTLNDGGIQKLTENTGVFAEATYSLNDTTRLTGGLRYDKTEVAVAETTCNTIGGGPTCASIGGSAGERDWTNLTYKARVEHDLAPGNMLYGSISTAFLPGDVALVTGAGGSINPAPYDAQMLTSYEIGSKNRFFDNRMTVNAAAFFYDYGGYQTPIQIGAVGPIILSQIDNTKVEVKGAELEATYRLTPVDEFGLNFSYVDAQFADKSAKFAASVAQTDIPNITPVSVTVDYSHTFVLDGFGSLRLKGEAAYASAHDVAILTQEQAAVPAMAALFHQDDVLLGNVYATWTPEKGDFSVSAYVRNIADKRYVNWVEGAGVTTRLNALLGAPRTAGILAQVKF